VRIARTLLLSLLILASAIAQAPQFEVATVKPAQEGARGSFCKGGPGTQDPGLLSCRNYSLSFLVMMAYNLNEYQFKGLGWMDGRRFDLDARIPAGTSVTDFRLMQQRLLAERFGLRVHHESQQMNGFELGVSKNGSKLVDSNAPVDATKTQLWIPPLSGPSRPTRAYLTRKGDSSSELAAFLAARLGQPVWDATGLKGRYDYAFGFVMGPGGRALDAQQSDATATDFGVSLFDAVRQQLGLTLKKMRGSVEVLIVDQAEKTPTEN